MWEKAKSSKNMAKCLDKKTVTNYITKTILNSKVTTTIWCVHALT
jgi:hypothetical protein